MIDFIIPSLEENQYRKACIESIRNLLPQEFINIPGEPRHAPHSENVNWLLGMSKNRYVIIIDDDIEFFTAESILEPCVMLMRSPQIGLVSVRQTKTVFETQTWLAYPHLFTKGCVEFTKVRWTPGYFLAFDREKWNDTLRFDNNIPHHYPDCGIGMNDLDLCMTVGEAGYDIVMCNHHFVFHKNDLKRPPEDLDRAKWGALYVDQYRYMIRKWGDKYVELAKTAGGIPEEG